MAYRINFTDITQFVGTQALPNYNGIEIPYSEKKKCLLKWIEAHPQHNPDGSINEQKTKAFLDNLMTDPRLAQLIASYLAEEYPIYVSEKERQRKEMAFDRFIKKTPPTREEVLRAFSWFLCPSKKAEFWNNLAKFDSFMKNVSNTMLNTKYKVDPTMLILYSAKGRTGKSFRLEAIQETVANLGFSSSMRTAHSVFGKDFHSVSDYNNGLMVINEWDNQYEIDYTLLKNLIDQKPITIRVKNKPNQNLDLKSCVIGASNYIPKTQGERRVSIIDFAEVPYSGDFDVDDSEQETLSSIDPEFVTQDEKATLFQYILQTYHYYFHITDINKSITHETKNKKKYCFIGNMETKNAGELNTARYNTVVTDSLLAYLEAKKPDGLLDLAYLSSWISKKHEAQLPARDLDSLISDLVKAGHLCATTKTRRYTIVTDAEAIQDYLFPGLSKDRYTYQETFDLLKAQLDLSFLPEAYDQTPRFQSEGRYFDLYSENPEGEYECLNDFKSLSPTDGHKTIRTQDNVYLDKFLFEIDHISGKSTEDCLELQKKLLHRLQEQRVVYRAVFSGKKSIHIMMKLDPKTSDMPTNVDEYKFVWKLLAEQYGLIDADRACNEPARLTRRPNVVRADTKKQQELVCADKFAVSLKWFDKYADAKFSYKTASASASSPCIPNITSVSTFIPNYMKKHGLEYKQGQRNTVLCKLRGALDAAGIEYSEQDLLDCGFEDEIVTETNNLSPTKRI